MMGHMRGSWGREGSSHNGADYKMNEGGGRQEGKAWLAPYVTWRNAAAAADYHARGDTWVQEWRATGGPRQDRFLSGCRRQCSSGPASTASMVDCSFASEGTEGAYLV